MIVWINGSFGSGKTTLVDELHARMPDSLLFDPENIGYVLVEIVGSPTGDFQDLRQWRAQVANFAIGLYEEYQRPVFVPMTLINPQYLGEIMGAIAKAGIPVRHFFLNASRELLEQRIDGRSFTPDDPAKDEKVRQFCKSKIDSALAVVPELPSDTILLDPTLAPDKLADIVLAEIGATPAAQPQ
jgi:AAA domain-containing protein